MKFTLIILAFLSTTTAFSQKDKTAAKDTTVQENLDTVKLVSAVDLQAFYLALGDPIKLENGESKVFSANERDIIVAVLRQTVMVPAAQNYLQKKKHK